MNVEQNVSVIDLGEDFEYGSHGRYCACSLAAEIGFFHAQALAGAPYPLYCIGMPVKAKSTSGTRPDTISAMARPEPHPIVQPRAPWPVLKKRLRNFVLPI